MFAQLKDTGYCFLGAYTFAMISLKRTSTAPKARLYILLWVIFV